MASTHPPAPETRAAFLQRYEAGPALLRAAWEAVPPAAGDWRPGPGRWTAREVVIHCADSEAYGAVRIRLLLTAPEPLIVGYDETVWATAFDYAGADPELALILVAALREHTVRTLRRLPDSAWGRAGRHTDSGAYTDSDWLRIYAEHLEVHAAQIRRNLAAWKP